MVAKAEKDSGFEAYEPIMGDAILKGGFCLTVSTRKDILGETWVVFGYSSSYKTHIVGESYHCNWFTVS